MKSWRDWIGAFAVVLVIVAAGSAPESEAGPLRRVARGVGRGAAAVGRFAYRRVTFQRLRGRAASCESSGVGYSSGGGCENGVCR